MAMRRTGSLRRGIKPEGVCWCGCAKETTLGKYWLPGHDSLAVKAVMEREFGDRVDFLDALGYGPGRRNAMTGEQEGGDR